MLWRKHILGAAMAAGLLLVSCEPEKTVIIPDTPEDTTTTPQEPAAPPAGAVIPENMTSLPTVYINTPDKIGVNSKTEWVELARLEIKGDDDITLLKDDSLKIRGRGNTNWWYPKKPYYIKLNQKADLLGTGKSRRWVLMANWMDRTLLRNDVAFEAARRTKIEWNPSGRFVELYLDDNYLGIYWLGEKIHVEGSKFKADFLYSFDTSDQSEWMFNSSGTYMANVGQWGAPVEVKYPDQDDYTPEQYSAILTKAQNTLKAITDDLAAGNLGKIDVDSFCDWYLVHELCLNLEPNHPKSCFFFSRGGKMYAGPVWDFDWYTFIPGQDWLGIKYSLWFQYLLGNDSFKARLKERWAELKPKFATLPDYVDARANIIRDKEPDNHYLWPCDDSSVNGDETLSFQAAVERMKLAITQRIAYLDKAIPAL